MIETIMTLGSAALAGPMCVRVMWRVYGLKRAVDKGHSRHLFEPHIRRDIHGKVETKLCDVCFQGPKAWIHKDRPSSDAAEGNYSTGAQILELETADIKWRFSNDLEWVKIFGEDYDPKTYRPIPQFHNGECGGPNDSCERCAWEADQADAKAAAKREAEERKHYYSRRKDSESEKRLTAEERDGYEDILWTVWNTCHDPDDAKEEFEDLQDEIGMLKNTQLRRDIKESDVYKRLSWCLSNPEKYWKRREEAWQNRLKQLRDRRNYY